MLEGARFVPPILSPLVFETAALIAAKASGQVVAVSLPFLRT